MDVNVLINNGIEIEERQLVTTSPSIDQDKDNDPSIVDTSKDFNIVLDTTTTFILIYKNKLFHRSRIFLHEGIFLLSSLYK